MIADQQFLDEVLKRTGCTFADLGFEPTDIDLWIEGEDSAQDAVTNLIVKYGLDDLTEPWGV
jgi:hypothetical protein